jgi:hypothetical protein
MKDFHFDPIHGTVPTGCGQVAHETNRTLDIEGCGTRITAAMALLGMPAGYVNLSRK